MEKVLQMEKVPGDGDEVGDTVSLSSSAAIHVSFAYRDCHSLSPCLPGHSVAVPGSSPRGGGSRESQTGLAAVAFLPYHFYVFVIIHVL